MNENSILIGIVILFGFFCFPRCFSQSEVLDSVIVKSVSNDLIKYDATVNLLKNCNQINEDLENRLNFQLEFFEHQRKEMVRLDEQIAEYKRRKEQQKFYYALSFAAGVLFFISLEEW